MNLADILQGGERKIVWDDFKLKTLSKFENSGAFKKEMEFELPDLPQRIKSAAARILRSPFIGCTAPQNDYAYLFANHYVGHSGGKDSVLVRWLADIAGLKGMMTVHTPKPEGVRNAVHPLTKEFVYALNRPVLHIPDGQQDAFKVMNLVVQIDGTRRAEADRRDGRDVGLIVDGVEKSRSEVPLYLDTGLFGQSFIYPIYDWTDAEVWATIFAYNIPYSAEYNE